MIMPVCIKPMEDELTYSWLSRLSKENGYSSLKAFEERFLTKREDVHAGSKTPYKARLDFLLGLERICEEYSAVRSFPSLDKILKKMSPLYAVFPFFTYGYQAQWIQFILRDQNETSLDQRNRWGMVSEILVCPLCMKEDQKKYGFPYLHTWHHLPGVRCCAVHKVPLCAIPHQSYQALDLETEFKKAEEKSPVENWDTEQKISQFAKMLYETPPFFDVRGLQALFLERMGEMGVAQEKPYEGMKEAMEAAGFLPYMQGNCASRTRIMLMEPWHKLDEIMAFTAFLFEDFSLLKERVQRYLNEFSEPFRSMINGRFSMLSEFEQVVRLQCETCGRIFYIHPYALALGCGCPDCDSQLTRNQMINKRLAFLGDGQYEIVEDTDENADKSTKGQVKILHKTCGKIRKIRLADAIWMEKKCECQSRMQEEDVRRRVRASSKEFTLIRYIGGGTEQTVVLRHKKCGKTFTTDLRRFERRPACMECERIRPRKYSTELFREKIAALVGNEYELEGGFVDQTTKICVRHKICGTITKMLPSEFLGGRRCDLCQSSVSQREVEETLERCTDGYYRVAGAKNYVFTVEGKNGKTFSKDARYIMQELSRPTNSLLFEYRIGKPEIRERNEWLVYRSAKSVCEKKGYWRSIDCVDTDLSKPRVRKVTQWLVLNKYLERIGYGKYIISENRL